MPASSTLSEVFLDDGDWSKAQFASSTPKETAKTPETTTTTESNGQIMQTTSLTNGIEIVDDKKALSRFFVEQIIGKIVLIVINV